MFFYVYVTLLMAAFSLIRPGYACASGQFQHSQAKLPERHHGEALRDITPSTREYWMQRANEALSELGSPCPFAAFATAIVNHTDPSTLGELICVGVNFGSAQGNPTLHGEISAINRCSAVLQGPSFGLTPAETLLAFHDLTLYTNGEPCPMCASAIRWTGFRECVYGTSIDTLVRLGWNQIAVSSGEIFNRSEGLPTRTTLIADVLASKTDPFFSWQFNSDALCPRGCARVISGKCAPV